MDQHRLGVNLCNTSVCKTHIVSVFSMGILTKVCQQLKDEEKFKVLRRTPAPISHSTPNISQHPIFLNIQYFLISNVSHYPTSFNTQHFPKTSDTAQLSWAGWKHDLVHHMQLSFYGGVLGRDFFVEIMLWCLWQISRHRIMTI